MTEQQQHETKQNKTKQNNYHYLSYDNRKTTEIRQKKLTN